MPGRPPVPVAALALDEFLIWVNANSPLKDAKSYIEAAKKGDGLRMGGSQSKDTDQTLVSIISRERAKDPTKWGSQEIATLIAKLSQQEANSNEAG